MSPKELQRERALRHANVIRLGRARLKERIRAGSLSVVEAMADPCVSSMRIVDLLVEQRKWGPKRAQRLLAQLGFQGVVVSPSRRISDLTLRQREALCRELAR